MQKNKIHSKQDAGSELPDSLKDGKNMESNEIVIEVPDVEDIPGQENVKPAPLWRDR
ncbi:MAG: hypothetical protein ABI550_09850 [Ignavibacteriaceae bacterium]